MKTGTELISAQDAAVKTLYELLIDNYNDHYWINYTAGHQERMANINTVLQSEGGKETVEVLIQKIILARETASIEAANENAKDKQYRKKHPFINFFGGAYNEHEENYKRKNAYIQALDEIKCELVDALRLLNVIKLSALSNKPKI